MELPVQTQPDRSNTELSHAANRAFHFLSSDER